MQKPLSRTNQKLIAELRAALDLNAIERAFQDGLITEGQAKRLVKFITAAIHIRNNPAYVVTDIAGKIVGEVVTRENGTIFIGRRYGENYPNNAEKFSSLKLAQKFVLESA